LIKTKSPGVLSVLSKASAGQADQLVVEGDVISFGNRSLKVLSTPGHTEGCISFVMDDESRVFTGDTLLIRGCGRTDFQGGDAGLLWDGVRSKLFTLPPTCAVYPAHDYKGRTQSTIGEEVELNPRLTKSKEEFQEIMANLGLNRPAKMDTAVPANMRCGVPDA
jgi:sulfur dioxygenase